MIHQHDFIEVDKDRGVLTFKEFVALLDWLVSQEDITVLSVDRATAAIEDLTTKRLAANCLYDQLYDLLYPKLAKLTEFPNGVYLVPGVLASLTVKLCGVVLLVYSIVLLVCGIVGFGVGLAALAQSRVVALILVFATPLVPLLASIYALRDGVFGRCAATVVAVCIGGWLGILACYVRMKRKKKAIEQRFSSRLIDEHDVVHSPKDEERRRSLQG